MATEEAVPRATSKHLGSTLVGPTQLQVRLALLEIVLLAELGAPERQTIGVDDIVRGAADQAERRDILVGVEFVDDGLVELSKMSVWETGTCVWAHTSMGRTLNAAALDGL
jgi:hypothetical protein